MNIKQKILLSLLTIFVFSSCSDQFEITENSIEGPWKLKSILDSNGQGDVIVENNCNYSIMTLFRENRDFNFTFKNDFDCNGDFEEIGRGEYDIIEYDDNDSNDEQSIYRVIDIRVYDEENGGFNGFGYFIPDGSIIIEVNSNSLIIEKDFANNSNSNFIRTITFERIKI